MTSQVAYTILKAWMREAVNCAIKLKLVAERRADSIDQEITTMAEQVLGMSMTAADRRLRLYM